MKTNSGGRVKRWFKAPMVADALGYLWVINQPLLRRINIKRRGTRRPDATHILLPEGYEADVFNMTFNAPVHCTFDEQGLCYITEAGYRIDSPPRIWRMDLEAGTKDLVLEISEEDWIKTGALTGCCWNEGYLYYSYNDHIGRMGPDGTAEKIVTGLPGLGDHQLSPPIFGPDGKLYFTTGSVTNCGVVGADNMAYEWLRNPDFQQHCEVAGQDIKLAGHNFETQDVISGITKKAKTGAFVPFGTETEPGQVIKGSVKCNTGVLRCDPDGSNLELVAWGLRNAFGLKFNPEGVLYATEHGIDERGARFIIGDYDDFYKIEEGAWYGYPDYASGIRLDDPTWGDGGRGREPVIADPPDADPPKPYVSFQPHCGSNGFDFCKNEEFGFLGDAFVALFGDAAPITTRRIRPAGFKVVRVDMKDRRIEDFAVNRIAGGASILPHEGFERPSHCEFGPDGDLYVVDWGEMVPAPERAGVEIRLETGLLWRIRPMEGPKGRTPPAPKEIYLNLLRFTVPLVGAIVLAIVIWLISRRR